MTVNLNNKQITLKNSFRAMMMYENINGSTYLGGGLTEAITYFYCVVVTSSKDYELSYDEFVNYLDENPDKLQEFSKWVTEISKNQNQLKKD